MTYHRFLAHHLMNLCRDDHSDLHCELTLLRARASSYLGAIPAQPCVVARRRKDTVSAPTALEVGTMQRTKKDHHTMSIASDTIKQGGAKTFPTQPRGVHQGG
eukprot:4482929-Amphidinium_carterae.1